MSHRVLCSAGYSMMKIAFRTGSERSWMSTDCFGFKFWIPLFFCLNLFMNLSNLAKSEVEILKTTKKTISNEQLNICDSL